jgi:hypothetical protein
MIFNSGLCYFDLRMYEKAAENLGKYIEKFNPGEARVYYFCAYSNYGI